MQKVAPVSGLDSGINFTLCAAVIAQLGVAKSAGLSLCPAQSEVRLARFGIGPLGHTNPANLEEVGSDAGLLPFV